MSCFSTNLRFTLAISPSSAWPRQGSPRDERYPRDRHVPGRPDERGYDDDYDDESSSDDDVGGASRSRLRD